MVTIWPTIISHLTVGYNPARYGRYGQPVTLKSSAGSRAFEFTLSTPQPCIPPLEESPVLPGKRFHERTALV